MLIEYNKLVIFSLVLPDGIHPTAEGHRIVAETVWQTLQTVL